MRSPDREVIPTILNPGDVCAQDEGLFDEGDFENYRKFGATTLDLSAWKAEDRRFHQAYLAVLGGERAWGDPDLLDAARRLCVDAPRHHDARPGRIAGVQVHDEVLCDVVEDAVPEWGMLLERITGVPGSKSQVGAVAALGFLQCGIEGTRPIDSWMDEEPDRALVQSVRVIADAPVGVWVGGRQLMKIVPALCPPAEAVAGKSDRSSPSRSVGSGIGAFVARAYRTQAGWAFSGVVPLDPGTSDGLEAVLERRMVLELWRLRRRERRATFEDAIRVAPAVVYRTAGEWGEIHRTR